MTSCGPSSNLDSVKDWCHCPGNTIPAYRKRACQCGGEPRTDEEKKCMQDSKLCPLWEPGDCQAELGHQCGSTQPVGYPPMAGRGVLLCCKNELAGIKSTCVNQFIETTKANAKAVKAGKPIPPPITQCSELPPPAIPPPDAPLDAYCIEDTTMEKALKDIGKAVSDTLCVVEGATPGTDPVGCIQMSHTAFDSINEWINDHPKAHIKVGNVPGGGKLCPWDHGWGGRGFTVCKSGCHSGNKNTTGCADKQWCSDNLALSPNWMCECGAADKPYICKKGKKTKYCKDPRPSPSPRPVAKSNYQGGCNNANYITCNQTHGTNVPVYLKKWDNNNATGLFCDYNNPPSPPPPAKVESYLAPKKKKAIPPGVIAGIVVVVAILLLLFLLYLRRKLYGPR